VDSLRTHQAAVASAASRHKREQTEDSRMALAEEQTRYAAAKAAREAAELAGYVRRVVETAPPLSEAQRQRLAVIFSTAALPSAA
jgi:hypothetical protein